MRSSLPGYRRCCCNEVLCWSRACDTAWPMVMHTMKEHGDAVCRLLRVLTPTSLSFRR